MEIYKSDLRTISLQSYSIEREASDQPVTVRAEILVTTPNQMPSPVRVRVKYETNEIPGPNQHDFGRKMHHLLRLLFDTP